MAELERMFCEYAKTGRGRTRTSAHDTVESKRTGVPPREFAARAPFLDDTCLSFYERLHGSAKNDAVDLPALADLKIGVVPVITLKWIQKIHLDRDSRGYSTETLTDVILRRMHADVHCICPQFTQTDINFQWVRRVDTSNPSVASWIPAPDESLIVIRFRNPRGIDFPYLTVMINGSWMSRANSIVVPGNNPDVAMQLILTPLIE